MGIYKSLYYENLLSIIINFLLFSCSGTSNLAKLLQDWQLFPVVYCLIQGVTKLKFLVTYICPNHLKLYMGIYKSLYYENLLSIIINFLLFSCSGTSHLAKLLQDWQLFPVVYYENLLSIIINFLLFSQSSTSHLAKLLQDWQLFLVVYCLTGCHKIKVFSHLYMSKSLETLYGYL